MNVWSHHENGSCTPCWQEKLWFSSFIQVFEHRKIIKSIFNRDNINNGYTKWFMVIIGKWISVSLAADLIHIYCLYTSWESLWKYLIFNEINDRSVICRLHVMHIYIFIILINNSRRKDEENQWHDGGCISDTKFCWFTLTLIYLAKMALIFNIVDVCISDTTRPLVLYIYIYIYTYISSSFSANLVTFSYQKRLGIMLHALFFKMLISNNLCMKRCLSPDNLINCIGNVFED